MEIEESSSKWEPVPNEFHGCLINDIHVVGVRPFDDDDRAFIVTKRKELRKGVIKILLLCAVLCIVFAVFATLALQPNPSNVSIVIVGVSVLALPFALTFSWLFWNRKVKHMKALLRISQDQLVLGFPDAPEGSDPETEPQVGFDLGSAPDRKPFIEVSWPSSYGIRLGREWLSPPEKVELEYVAAIPQQARMSAEFASTIGPDFQPQFRELTSEELAEISKICRSEMRLLIGPAILVCYFIARWIQLLVTRASSDASDIWVLAIFSSLGFYFGRGVPAQAMFIWRLKQDLRAGYLTIFRDPDENRVIEMLINSKLIWSIDLEASRFRREPFKFRIPFKNPADRGKSS